LTGRGEPRRWRDCRTDEARCGPPTESRDLHHVRSRAYASSADVWGLPRRHSIGSARGPPRPRPTPNGNQPGPDRVEILQDVARRVPGRVSLTDQMGAWAWRELERERGPVGRDRRARGRHTRFCRCPGLWLDPRASLVWQVRRRGARARNIHASRLPQVGAAQVRAEQLRPLEPRVGQGCVAQVRAAQVGRAQMGAVQLRVTERRILEMRVGELREGEPCPSSVRVLQIRALEPCEPLDRRRPVDPEKGPRRADPPR
jgi:hypothetical protein